MQATKHHLVGKYLCTGIIVFYQLFWSNTSTATYPVRIHFYNNGPELAHFLVNHKDVCSGAQTMYKGKTCVITVNSNDTLIGYNSWFFYIILPIFGDRCHTIKLNNVNTIPKGAKTVVIDGKIGLDLTIWFNGKEEKTWLDYRGGPAKTGGIKTTVFKDC